MRSDSAVKLEDVWVQLEEQYASLLRNYVAEPTPAGLQPARGLGSSAVKDGLGLREFVSLHEDALASTLPPDSNPAVLARTLREGRRFLVEALEAYQANHLHSAVLRRLNASLNTKLEEEARRIAHTLHDEAGQLLASVHLALEDLSRESPPRGRERIAVIRAMLDRIEQDLRNLCHEIRPTMLDTIGLQPAVKFLAKSVAARTGLRVDVRGSTGGRLPQVVETNLYRIIQEALANAVRHARASRAVVRFDRAPNGLGCTITDDGVGFDPAVDAARATANGLGLVGMHERVDSLGGGLQIRSRPAHGTEIHVFVPLDG